MESQLFHIGEEQFLFPNEYQKEGYTFAGWNTEADGSGDLYSDGQRVSFIVADSNEQILYAQWVAKEDSPIEEESETSTMVTPASDFTYSINSDDNVIITKYDGYADIVEIPSTIEGKTVTGLQGAAWNNPVFKYVKK